MRTTLALRILFSPRRRVSKTRPAIYEKNIRLFHFRIFAVHGSFPWQNSTIAARSDGSFGGLDRRDSSGMGAAAADGSYAMHSDYPGPRKQGVRLRTRYNYPTQGRRHPPIEEEPMSSTSFSKASHSAGIGW